MIELALQKGNMALAHKMIERTAPVGHLDANMLTIRNQYLSITSSVPATTAVLMNI